MKKIIVLDEDMFITNALSDLLPTLTEPAEVTHSFVDIESLERFLFYGESDADFDILLVEPKSSHYSLSKCFKLIKEFQKNSLSEKKIIIFTQLQSEPLSLFLQNMKIGGIISKSLSIKRLSGEFQLAMLDESIITRSNNSLFTASEHDVLIALMSGELPKQIADYRRCSEKTISAHKRMALQKLGMTSIPNLLRAIEIGKLGKTN